MSGSAWIGWGATMAFIGVALGAFGAHGLRENLEPRMMEIFETAVRYQMYHALALILFGLSFRSIVLAVGERAAQFPGFAFLFGILFFSGSLYALALTGVRVLGAITPIGGVFFLVAWASWAYFGFKGGAVA